MEEREPKMASESATQHQAAHRLRFNPWQEIEAMRHRLTALLDNVVGDFSGQPFVLQPRTAAPDLDLLESETEYLLRVALPGVEPDALRLEATPHRLTIDAEIRPAALAASQEWRRLQTGKHTGATRFHIVFELPTEIDPSAIQSALHHGLLEMRLPKMTATHPPITISVVVGSPLASVSAAMATGQAPTSSAPASAEMRQHEGNPASKMGLAYKGGTSEDHATYVQNIANRPESEREGRDLPAATGSLLELKPATVSEPPGNTPAGFSKPTDERANE